MRGNASMPPMPDYPPEQPREQANRVPISAVPLRPPDSFGYDMDGGGAPTSIQARVKPGQAGKQTWAQAGIKDVKRQLSPALLSLIIILSLSLITFVSYNFRLMQAPIDAVKDTISKIELPSSIPFLSSLFEKDTVPPVISNVVVANVTDSSAIITWTTDGPATSQVMYCEPGGLCQWTEPQKKLVTDHSVTVNDLKPGMTYHYTISSIDASENEATSEGELTTLSGR